MALGNSNLSNLAAQVLAQRQQQQENPFDLGNVPPNLPTGPQPDPIVPNAPGEPAYPSIKEQLGKDVAPYIAPTPAAPPAPPLLAPPENVPVNPDARAALDNALATADKMKEQEKKTASGSGAAPINPNADLQMWRDANKEINALKLKQSAAQALAARKLKNGTGEEADAAQAQADAFGDKIRELEIGSQDARDRVLTSAAQDSYLLEKLNPAERSEVQKYIISNQSQQTMQNLEAQHAAQKEKLNAQLEGAKKEAEYRLQSEQEMQKLTAQQMEERKADEALKQDTLAKLNQANQDLSNYKATIDPNRYWSSKSTPNKILSGILLLIGSAAAGAANQSGKGHTVSPVEIFQKAISDDIAAQEREATLGLEAKKGAASGYANQFQLVNSALNNKEATRQYLKAEMYKDISNHMQTLAAEQTSQERAAELKRASAALDAESLALKQKTEIDLYNISANELAKRQAAQAAAAAAARAAAEKDLKFYRESYRDFVKSATEKGSRVEELPTFDKYVASFMGGAPVKLSAGGDVNADTSELAKRATSAGIPEAQSALANFGPKDIKDAATGKLINLFHTAKPNETVTDVIAKLDPDTAAANQRLLAILNPLLKSESGAAVTATEMARHLDELRGDGSPQALEAGILGLQRKLDAKAAGVYAGFDDKVVNTYKTRLGKNNPNAAPSGFKKE